MTAFVNPVRPFNPPYHHREYLNDINGSPKKSCNTYKRVALVALPFLSFYKPLSAPISLGLSSIRVYTFSNQLIRDIQLGDWKKFF